LNNQPPQSREQLRLWIAGRLSGRSLAPLAESLAALLPDVARAEGVSSLLLECLRRNESGALCPDVMRQLVNAERDGVGNDLLRAEEVRRVLAALRDSGVEFLLLKGEALAHSLYPQSHLRSRSDVDLLFDGGTGAERAWEILQSLGYQRSPTLQGRFVGFQFTCQRRIAGGVEMQFDIHREICDLTWFSRRLCFADMMACAQVVSLQGVTVSVPDWPHALLHACLHRVLNKQHGTENRLVWLYDIHLLCERLGDRWPEFVALARELDMARICLQAVCEARRCFTTTVDLAALADAARVENPGLANARSRRQLYLLDWWHNPGLGNKFVQLREHLFPGSRYMRAKYGVNHRVALPYYYLKRLVQGLLKNSA